MSPQRWSASGRKNPATKNTLLITTFLIILIVPFITQAEKLSGAHQETLQREAIPVYPGSSFTTSDIGDTLTVLWFKSSDSPATIMAWYKQQLTGWFEIEANGMVVLYKGPPGLEAKQLSDKPYIFTRSTTESEPISSEITIRLPKN